MHPLVVLAALSTTLVLQDPNRIAGASNVRIRTGPVASANVVASVPLGTPLLELESGGETGQWVRVRLADGRDGWTLASFTRKVTADTRWQVSETLIKERLARRGDSFAARAELVAFIEQSRTTALDPEASGRAALYWLQSMSAVLEGIPMSQSRAEPYATWLAARKDIVVYNEPGGRWILRQSAIFDLHRREQDSSSADDIAWFITVQGLPGECEGFVPCYVRRADLIYGEYLRRHSAGRHANEAVEAIAARTAELARTPARSGFLDPSRDCAELTASLDPLRAAVAATRVDSRDAALSSLEALRRRCGTAR